MTLHRRHTYRPAGPSTFPGAVVERCECGARRLRPAGLERACCGHCLRSRHDLCGLGECCRVVVWERVGR